MAQQYRLNRKLRFYNHLMKWLLRLGIAPTNVYLLKVAGRKTGKLYSTPVTLIEEGPKRWLIAPYGEVAWVRNARAAGEVTLLRGNRTERMRIVPASPEESAPLLKTYITRISIVRPYFDVRPESSLEDFEVEAPRHPVFRLHAV